MFYLMDLERTIAGGIPYFWKVTRHGYTKYIEQAGLFDQKVAEEIVKRDLDNATVMIDERLVFKILGKDMKQHEGSST